MDTLTLQDPVSRVGGHLVPPEDDIAAAWQVIAFALGKFRDDDGRPVFDGWLRSLPYIDIPWLRECCEAIAARKEASSFVTVTLSTVKAEYLKRRQSAGSIPACSACHNLGVVYAVQAGETAGTARIVERHHVAPYGYVATTTMPCDCQRGQHFAAKQAKAHGWDAPYSPSKWVRDVCVFASGRDAEAMARQCRELKAKQGRV